ncbi:MAG: SAM-dependent methyltransferase [Paracoccaceae bacterium]|jgi:NADH dehydrogenase [ubiquinone] 1 alpha subcomplex assembly factor 7|nr:SAM-dependent methyltransferase [Paracoccaceae bacterium]
MTAQLTDLLIRRIRAEGPISLADYMATCLLHPEYGYYATRDPFGLSGDFITAPEISQMFGELIGLSLAQSWMDQGSPSSFVLAELGPGRGTLMADILRATKIVPGFLDAASVYLVEASRTLGGIQAETLKDWSVHWIDDVTDLPDAPLWLVANEFFDALPVRQFERGDESWRERMVHVDEHGSLGFGLAQETKYEDLRNRLEDTNQGDIIETCPSAAGIIRLIGDRIETLGGAALIFDYGDWHSLGDTFQALRKHHSIHPFESPGQADLTAHVDFEALALAAPCSFSRVTPQGIFLERLGIVQRAQTLAKNLSGETLEDHVAAFRRLTHPDEMGTLFKTMALFPKGANPPPGVSV